ncbi:hypothetical protein JGK46_004478 [Aeromonas bestiarum]|nr:hypothetical protein [Aeromonas bestiarum]EKP0280532.1 hypothetical protein [Aeromonas bestiarum]
MIEVTCVLNDNKVNSKNIQFTIDIKSYVELSKQVINNNPFQRNKVSRSGSVYTLLKEDILKGCIIPPIVLASTFRLDYEDSSHEKILSKILSEPKDLKILDGLQRTFSLIEVYDNNKDFFDKNEYLIRVEVYLSISDTGILYRMLTLNTGQTPMTLRHQLEILFSKYLDGSVEELRIIKEVDDDAVRTINEYKFSDLIDGYNSFLERNELPIDRFDILQTVQTIQLISHDDNGDYEFKNFVKTYNVISRKFEEHFKGWTYPSDDNINAEFKTKANPFGKLPFKIFNRSQAITGFGAAIGELIDLDSINGLSSISKICNELIFTDNDLLNLNKCLDDVREKSKKIGNGQRIFFKLFFKHLFDKDGNTFKNVGASLEKAKKRALAEV